MELKKRDIILLLSIILLGVIMLAQGKLTAEKGDTVVITLDGNLYREYPLDTDTEIDINGTNTAKIENSSVYMKTASCPDHLCIHQGKISDSSKKIVCLPNKVTIEVTKKSEIDKVVR